MISILSRIKGRLLNGTLLPCSFSINSTQQTVDSPLLFAMSPFQALSRLRVLHCEKQRLFNHPKAEKVQNKFLMKDFFKTKRVFFSHVNNFRLGVTTPLNCNLVKTDGAKRHKTGIFI